MNFHRRPSALHPTPRRAVGGRVSAWVVLTALAFAVWCLASVPAFAQAPPEDAYQIVVHPQNPTVTMGRELMSQTFLKKVATWSHGGVVRPADLPPSSAVRKRFSTEVLGRSVSAVRSYWLQVIFAGRGAPPPELKSDEEVIRFVLSEPGAIGYVSSRADLRGAHVVVVR
ncbi:MAG: hypothetical protein ABW133_23015 [Polyangiaceae bacterium]